MADRARAARVGARGAEGGTSSSARTGRRCRGRPAQPGHGAPRRVDRPRLSRLWDARARVRRRRQPQAHGGGDRVTASTPTTSRRRERSAWPWTSSGSPRACATWRTRARFTAAECDAVRDLRGVFTVWTRKEAFNQGARRRAAATAGRAQRDRRRPPELLDAPRLDAARRARAARLLGRAGGGG